MINITLKNIEFIKGNIEKEAVLRKFADLADNTDNIFSKDDFYNGLVEREEEFSTGIGARVAVPHCKSNTVKRASVFIQKFDGGIEWGALDGEPVELAICLAVPENEAGTTHLKLLSRIARSLINKEFTAKLLKITDKEELLGEINNIINQ